MYINAQKRKLDPRDLDTVANAEYFTCIYYKPQGQSIRFEFRTYKQALEYAKRLFKNRETFIAHAYYTPCDKFYENKEKLLNLIEHNTIDKRKFMFYAVKSTSQTFIGGLK